MSINKLAKNCIDRYHLWALSDRKFTLKGAHFGTSYFPDEVDNLAGTERGDRLNFREKGQCSGGN